MGLRKILALVVLAGSCLAQENPNPPNRKASLAPRATQSAIQRPSEFDQKRLQPAPSLAVAPEQAKEAVPRFIAWAGASNVKQREDARRIIAEARDNQAVASAFCDEALRSQRTDNSRSLLALSILGEMRSPVGQECLTKLLHQPFPEKGTSAQGEIVEQTALGMLQGKAVDGLAYLHTRAADEEVLWAAGKHPSRVVRAEAIEAYLWNHQDSEEARETLSRYIRPDEKIFLDRVRRDPGDSAEVFNRKLAVFLKAHPEAAAAAPQKYPRRKAPPSSQQPPAR